MADPTRSALESLAKDIEREQHARRRRDRDHDPQDDPRHMICRIASTIDDTQSGIDEIIVIEVEPKTPAGNQNEKQHAQM